MPLAEVTVGGLTVLDIALILGGVAYIASLLKDWRPIQHLRKENDDLRATLERQQHLYDELNEKYADLKTKYEKLEASRDFQKAFSEVVVALHEVVTAQQQMHDENRREAAESRKEMRAIVAALDAFAARAPGEEAA